MTLYELLKHLGQIAQQANQDLSELGVDAYLDSNFDDDGKPKVHSYRAGEQQRELPRVYLHRHYPLVTKSIVLEFKADVSLDDDAAPADGKRKFRDWLRVKLHGAHENTTVNIRAEYQASDIQPEGVGLLHETLTNVNKEPSQPERSEN